MNSNFGEILGILKGFRENYTDSDLVIKEALKISINHYQYEKLKLEYEHKQSVKVNGNSKS